MPCVHNQCYTKVTECTTGERYQKHLSFILSWTLFSKIYLQVSVSTYLCVLSPSEAEGLLEPALFGSEFWIIVHSCVAAKICHEPQIQFRSSLDQDLKSLSVWNLR